MSASRTQLSGRFPPHEPFRIIKEAGSSQLSSSEWLARLNADDAEAIRLAAYRMAQQFNWAPERFLEDLVELTRAYFEGEVS